ncbi:DUF6491 family protein [Chitiniphilus shinanonensis]|uniref:DUF6491 family protein n=1 Tax=Chitiniphilus shinanonensis TaxID=553088 RepID=UPI003023D72D
MPILAALLVALGVTLTPLAQGASAAPAAAPTASSPTASNPAARRHLRVPTTMRWRAIDQGDVLLWTGREEVWRLSLGSGCRALPRTGRLGFTAHHGHLVAGRDEIRSDGGSCPIDAIVAAPPAPRTGTPQAPTWPATRIEVVRRSNGGAGR